MSAEDKQPRNILVVDDEVDFQELMKMICAYEGYKVTIAECGDEALKILKDQKPDLIIIDIVMPRMSGIELARKLAAEEKTSTIPRMFVTATKYECEPPEIKSLVRDILYKPFDIDVMLDRLKKLIA